MKSHRFLIASGRRKYTQALVSQLAIITVYALIDNNISALIGSFLLLTTLALCLSFLALDKWKIGLYLGIACLAWSGDVIHIYMIESSLIATLFGSFVDLAYIFLIVLTIKIVIDDIFYVSEVNTDTIVGGICIFFLIANLWFVLYSQIYMLDANSFTYSKESLPLFDFLYFSFTTLTTVGYGDIVPVSDIAKFAANIEAMVGVMFPAVFIARLVGLYKSEGSIN